MRRRWGTIVLLTVLSLVFLAEWLGGAVADDARLLRFGALPESGQLDGDYWRLASFGLLHWDGLHLAENAVCLALLGEVVERRVGAGRLWLLFAVASLASGLAIFLKHYLHPGLGASVGASGGMFGVLGAALVLVRRQPPAQVLVRPGLTLLALGAFAFSLLPGISMAGHLAGFFTGTVLGRRLALQSAPSSAPSSA
jgi:rhomboid protease GluP